jgi:hypothetical protein
VLSLWDWLRATGQYFPAFASCGAALADRFYRGQAAAAADAAAVAAELRGGPPRIGGAAFPIRPCEGCALRWLACDLTSYGGGWSLVRETAGRVGLRSTDEAAPELLFSDGWATRGGEGGTAAADGLGAGFVAGLGKLGDAATRRLCSEQFMVVQPGRRPIFCRFDAGAGAFADGVQC